VITPDGCAVDFYALMPASGEPAIVHAAAGPGASILELGCGAGRVTHPLIALGHPVVAVDESPEMLAHVRGAETVCAQIQGLSVGRRFGAVLLASHLINADADIRNAFLEACRRHVARRWLRHRPAALAGVVRICPGPGGDAGRDRPPDARRVAPGPEPAHGHGGIRGRRQVLDADVHHHAPG
jgi:SAM-dependent methyltransferase